MRQRIGAFIAVAVALTLLTACGSPTSANNSASMTAGTSLPTARIVVGVNGRRQRLAAGPTGTVVIAMASWCKFCAFDDAYVVPMLVSEGVTVDIVDVSSHGGIGVPGPLSQAFTGADHRTGRLSLGGLVATMRRYANTFHLTQASVHVYVALPATVKTWHVTSYPTLYTVNKERLITHVQPTAAVPADVPQIMTWVSSTTAQ